MSQECTDEQKKVLRTLRKLELRYEAHDSGGFDPDDIQSLLHGHGFAASQIEGWLQEMADLGLVTSVEAPMGDDAWPSHWLLTEQGKGGGGSDE